MPISVRDSHSQANTVDQAAFTTTVGAIDGAGTDRAIVVGIWSGDSLQGDPDSVDWVHSGGSDPLTKIAAASGDVGGFFNLSLWAINGQTSDAGGEVTVTFPEAREDIIVSVVTLEGVDQSATFADVFKDGRSDNAQNTTDETVTHTGVVSSDLLVSVVGYDQSEAASAPANLTALYSGQTIQAEAEGGSSSFVQRGGISTRPGSSGSEIGYENQDWTSGGNPVQHGMASVVVAEASAATIEQEGYRFYNDDGNEASATARVAQDTVDTIARETNFLLRVLLDAADDPPSIAPALEYKKVTDSKWLTPGETTQDLVVEAGDWTQSDSNATSATLAVTIPALADGDLCIVNLNLWSNGAAKTVTLPSGPNGETLVAITNSTGSGTANTCYVVAAYWISDGAFAGGTLNFTASATTRFNAGVLKVLAGEFDPTTPISAQTGSDVSTADDATPDSGALTAASDDAGGKLIVIVAVDQDPISGTPAGYTDFVNDDAGRSSIVVSGRDAAVTASENITAVSWSITGDAWQTFSYIVRPAPIVNAIELALSTHFAQDAVTTNRLTAPASGSFQAGNMNESQTTADAIDLTSNSFTEIVWCLQGTANAELAQYEFRVTDAGTPLDTYTVNPRITFDAGLTQVSNSLILQSEVEEAISNALVLLQEIAQAVQSSLVAQNAIDDDVSNSLLLDQAISEDVNNSVVVSHEIEGAITSNLAISHAVAEAITNSAQITQALEVEISNSLAISHSLNIGVSQSTVLQHAIAAAIANNVTLQHAVEGAVSQQAIISSEIREKVENLLLVAWALEIQGQTSVSNSINFSWEVEGAVLNSLTISEQIIAAVLNGFTSQQELSEAVSQSLQANHQIIEALTNSAILANEISANVEAQQIIDSEIEGAVSDTLQLAYEIEVQIISDGVVRFNVTLQPQYSFTDEIVPRYGAEFEEFPRYNGEFSLN